MPTIRIIINDKYGAGFDPNTVICGFFPNPPKNNPTVIIRSLSNNSAESHDLKMCKP